MITFLQLASVKETSFFGEHPKQKFDPSYFVTALVRKPGGDNPTFYQFKKGRLISKEKHWVLNFSKKIYLAHKGRNFWFVFWKNYKHQNFLPNLSDLNLLLSSISSFPQKCQ